MQDNHPDSMGLLAVTEIVQEKLSLRRGLILALKGCVMYWSFASLSHLSVNDYGG